jgi:hypothetical protein
MQSLPVINGSMHAPPVWLHPPRLSVGLHALQECNTTLVDVAESDAGLAFLVALAKAAGLAPLLGDLTLNVTLFAPNNQAVTQLLDTAGMPLHELAAEPGEWHGWLTDWLADWLPALGVLLLQLGSFSLALQIISHHLHAARRTQVEWMLGGPFLGGTGWSFMSAAQSLVLKSLHVT